MSVPLANYTLTYSESSQGWPSFYSYHPEWIQGMNQYLYTFKGGNLYRHNVNETRNNYYGQDYPSTITTVLNTDALTTKVFKTIDLEAQDPWKATVYSDIQGARDIEVGWFKKKEGDWFAFIRGLSTNDNFNMRSAKGVGIPTTLVGTNPQTITFTNAISTPIQVGWFKKKEGDWFAFIRGLDRLDGQYNFNMRSAKGVGVPTTIVGTNPQTITFSVDITTPIQVGDSVFSTADTATIAPTLVGVISSIPAANQIIVDTTTSVQNPTTPAVSGDFVFYVRNQVAESQGLLGHYCVMTLENNLTTATEMMAVKVDLMKSYP
jgi:hypothetical protein